MSRASPTVTPQPRLSGPPSGTGLPWLSGLTGALTTILTLRPILRCASPALGPPASLVGMPQPQGPGLESPSAPRSHDRRLFAARTTDVQAQQVLAVAALWGHVHRQALANMKPLDVPYLLAQAALCSFSPYWMTLPMSPSVWPPLHGLPDRLPCRTVHGISTWMVSSPTPRHSDAAAFPQALRTSMTSGMAPIAEESHEVITVMAGAHDADQQGPARQTTAASQHDARTAGEAC